MYSAVERQLYFFCTSLAPNFRKRTQNTLFQVLAEKIYRLSENITCTVAGITADANILINHLRWYVSEFHESKCCFSEVCIQVGRAVQAVVWGGNAGRTARSESVQRKAALHTNWRYASETLSCFFTLGRLFKCLL